MKAEVSPSKPSTAIIIPVYNVEDYLPRCMQTVLNQTIRFDEIILVDDGSTDSSGLLCDRYAKNYTNVKVMHKENGGLSSARNAGISIAQSDCITFVDSDDWVSERYLEVLLNLLTSYEADMAMCEMVRVAKFDPEAVGKLPEQTEVTDYSRDEFMRLMLRITGNRTVHYACGKLYRKELLDRDHFPEGLLNEDVEACFKAILKLNSVVETSAPLYFYYQNPKSITGSCFGENYLNLTEVWRRVYELSENIAPQWSDAVHLNLIRSDFTILCDSLIHGNRATDEAYAVEIDGHLRSLRKNLFQLLRSPIALDRRVLIAIICAVYKPTLILIRLLRDR